MLASLAQASARHDNESQSVKGEWGSGVFSRRGEVAKPTAPYRRVLTYRK